MRVRDKKNSILFLLTLILSITLTSCGGKGDDSKDSSSTPTTNNLSIIFEKTNTGTGSVILSPSNIKCKIDCIQSFTTGVIVSLSNNADPGSSFKRYEGNADCLDDEVTMNAKIVCKPIFEIDPNAVVYKLSVTLVGLGTVSSSPAGIDCGTTCAKTFFEGSTVKLTPTPATGSTFESWSGTGCNTGTITMSTDVNCTATFKKISTDVNLTVIMAGTGSGSVSLSSPAGTVCNKTPCVTPSAIDSVVTLTAKPAANNTFAGWSGACTSVNANPVTTIKMSTAQSCTATFDVKPTAVLHNLVINLVGSASTKGEVTSIPAGINCGTVCNKDFTAGSNIALTAKPLDPTSKFVGWGGFCSGSALKTTVPMDAPKDCTATFDLVPIITYDLTVKKVGSGVITSKNGDIDCGMTCKKTYNANTDVELTATEAIGNKFDGWSGTGACNGSLNNTITVTMDGIKTCTATFSVLPVMTYNLTLLIAGTGVGTVTPNPKGSTCGSNCWTYNSGDTVELLLKTTTGTFTKWVEPICQSSIIMSNITMSGDISCTAQFDLALATFTLQLSTVGNGTGNVSPTPKGDTCGANCWTYNAGVDVELVAAAITGSFKRWEEQICMTGIVTMSNNRICTGVFELPNYDLTISVAGLGDLSIVTPVAPIGTCGLNCNQYPAGTVIDATVSPILVCGTFGICKLTSFINWVGTAADCSGTKTSISILVDATKTCTANFSQ